MQNQESNDELSKKKQGVLEWVMEVAPNAIHVEFEKSSGSVY